MTDTLRTRIANVIWEALRKQNNTVNFDALADAVIRELGLQECDDQDCRCRHRYVTEWTADE